MFVGRRAALFVKIATMPVLRGIIHPSAMRAEFVLSSTRYNTGVAETHVCAVFRAICTWVAAISVGTSLEIRLLFIPWIPPSRHAEPTHRCAAPYPRGGRRSNRVFPCRSSPLPAVPRVIEELHVFWQTLSQRHKLRFLEGVPEAKAVIAGSSGEGTDEKGDDLIRELVLAPIAWCFKVCRYFFRRRWWGAG